MEIFTVEKKTTFKNKDTEVKIKISDGYNTSIGEGQSHCADGDDFDEETGEEIASIRAQIKAITAMNNNYIDMICKYQKQIGDLLHIKHILGKRLKQLIE